MRSKLDTLEYYLLTYLKNHEGFHKKVDLYVIGDQEEYSPESVGRILRILSESGKIICEYYKGSKRGTKLAKYSIGAPIQRKLPTFKEIDGVRTMVYD